MTMSYDLFNSGLKRLKTPCIIMLFILWFFAYHVKIVFCVSEILTNFSTQKVGIVHIPWGLYIFQNGFHIDKSYRACRCVCTFALKPHYLKFIFILFFYAKPLIKFVQHPTILWLEVSVTYSSGNIRKTVRILMFKSKIHQKFLMFQK